MKLSLFAASLAAVALAATSALADPVATRASLPISVAANGTAQLIAASPAEAITVTHFDAMGPSGNFELVAGQGANCAINQVVLTGAYPAAQGVSAGGGYGGVIVAPVGYAVCSVTTGIGASPIVGLIAFDQS